MDSPFYQPGHKPQYGANRWARYENLRSSGFLKSEARELSRMHSPQALSVIRTMTTTRRKNLTMFVKAAQASGLTLDQARHRYGRAIKSWYGRRNIAGKQGRGLGLDKLVLHLYHRTENAMARHRGWKKGERDERVEKGESDLGRAKRRPKKKTPYKAKGDVKSQKARARQRRQAPGRASLGKRRREGRKTRLAPLVVLLGRFRNVRVPSA
jgi:hypothetical protein